MEKHEKEYEKKILVNSKEKKMYLFEKNKLIKTFTEVALGKNGVTENKQEGDGCTPKGVFSIGFAFGTEDLSIDYPYYKVDETIYWVSDFASEFYHQWVRVSKIKEKYPFSYMKTTDKINWKEAEHLIEYPILYELALVIEYNMFPIKKARGSAIFLHIKKKDYTEGCIGTTKENMEFLIRWLDKGKSIIEIQ